MVSGRDVIPYMIINLDYDRDGPHQQGHHRGICSDENKSCEYLEVNEVIEYTEYQNWTPKQRKDIIDSDLVFSPAQVTTPPCGAEGSKTSHKKQKTGL